MKRAILKTIDGETSVVYEDYELTEEEYQQERKIERDIFYAQSELTYDKKLSLLLDAIPVETLPQKEGYILVPHYDIARNAFVHEYVADPYYVPTADGSYLRPFTYEDGMPVMSGLFYEFPDLSIWECIKTDSVSSYSSEYFDIIG